VLGVDTRAKTGFESRIKDVTLWGDPEDYEPVNLLWWMRLISPVPLDRSRTTFADLGAGRGRALILAFRMGFTRVIGVEVDEHSAADTNTNAPRRSMRHPARDRRQEIQVLRTG
jgi:hypothetical protein